MYLQIQKSTKKGSSHDEKTLWVFLLAICIVFSCLAFTAQADSAPTFSVAASGGDYTTIESALADIEIMAKSGELNTAGVRLVLTGSHTATKTGDLLFGQKTIFLPSGLKLPITISGGTLNLPTDKVACANDYTFTDITIPFDDVATNLYAGTGNVTLGNIITDVNGTSDEHKSRFYGDNFTANAFSGWTEDHLLLYSENNLFTSSMTLAHGFRFGPKTPNIYAAVGSSTDFSAKVGSKTVSADDTCPKLIIDGAVMGHSMVRTGKNPTKNAILHIKSGTIGSLRAGGHSTQTTLNGDMTVIVDGGTLWDFPRLLRTVTLNGNLNLTLKNVDLMDNTVENGQMIQIAFSGVTINGDLSVHLENVKADRYYGGYVRFFVTEQATLNNSTTFVVDHIDRMDALAEELSTVSGGQQLGSALQYYIQAAAEYYPSQPNMENFEYPETFSAGWAIGDISPYGFRMQMYSYASGHFVIDPVYVTCLAMWDGDELALYYSFDLRQCDDTFTKTYKAILSEKFGVDSNKIFFNATHNHSSPDAGQRSKENVQRWYSEILEPNLLSVTKAAILDLAPAEVYAGTATSAPGTNYVRRYIREDGSFTGIHVYETEAQQASPIVGYESEADKELRTLRFTREDKKDIVLANWQGHAAHGANQYKTRFTGDFVYHLRAGVQKELDVNFIYCNGASGNLNFTPKTRADINAKYFTGNFFEGVGKSLVGTVKEAVSADKKINTGAFRVNHIEYVAPTKKDPDDIMAKAIETNEACKAYTAINGAWTSVSQQRDYIFKNFNDGKSGPYLQSTYHLSSLMTRNSYWTASTPTTQHIIDVFAFACGDFAMGFVPYEQFDTNAKQTRDGVADLYEITITGGYTNGTKSYVPSNFSSIDNEAAKEHYGGYEVYTCRYEDGTGDGVAAAIRDALREFKAAK